jgi:hypothetical protein
MTSECHAVKGQSRKRVVGQTPALPARAAVQRLGVVCQGGGIAGGVESP